MISWGIAESVNLLEGRVSSPAVSILAACGNVWCGVLEYWCDIVGGGAGSIWSGRVCIGSWNALFGSWCSEFCNGVGGILCGSCGVTNGNGGGWVWRRWGQRGTWGGVCSSSSSSSSSIVVAVIVIFLFFVRARMTWKLIKTRRRMINLKIEISVL